MYCILVGSSSGRPILTAMNGTGSLYGKKTTISSALRKKLEQNAAKKERLKLPTTCPKCTKGKPKRPPKTNPWIKCRTCPQEAHMKCYTDLTLALGVCKSGNLKWRCKKCVPPPQKKA